MVLFSYFLSYLFPLLLGTNKEIQNNKDSITSPTTISINIPKENLFGTFKNNITQGILKDGEYLKFRFHYGILTAGYADIKTSRTSYKGTPCWHVKGIGYSSGAVRAFFKVDDIYETYIDDNYLSLKFIRNITEGSYKRNQEMEIDHEKKAIVYKDIRKNTSKNFSFTGEIHDLLSAFYYMRSINTDSMKDGDVILLNIFMDGEILNFKIKLLGREEIKTKFGKTKALKLRPYVLSGRVFKEKESVTMWVSDDKNHIPLQLKASLIVGSLKADLVGYSNLAFPINFN